MSDLDKLMNKLKKGGGKIEEVKEETPQEPITDEFEDDPVEETQTPTDPTPEKVEKVRQEDPKTETHEEDHATTVNGEVAIFQNNGVFRRELLLKMQEQNDVLKVIAQTFLDIKKSLDGNNAK